MSSMNTKPYPKPINIMKGLVSDNNDIGMFLWKLKFAFDFNQKPYINENRVIEYVLRWVDIKEVIPVLVELMDIIKSYGDGPSGISEFLLNGINGNYKNEYKNGGYLHEKAKKAYDFMIKLKK